MSGISAATGGDANQVAAFTAGRGVAFNESFNWSSSPLSMPFPDLKIVDLKVWVLYTSSDCDFDCVRLKMSN